jgi:hypothetical protein
MTIVLAHLTAGGSAAFVAPVAVIVFLLLGRRAKDESDRAERRRRRRRAKRAVVREYWTLERRGGGWVVVEARTDESPDPVPASFSPWAEMPPSGNGHARAARDMGELVAALARRSEH